jgi:flagellin
MALSIVNNLAAFTAQQSLARSTTNLENALSHLSTGLRINSAADDPSGLAISERFRTQIRGLARATQNAMDAQSMLQVAEGSLAETHNILQRMRELAVQASNGVLTGSDRLEIQREVDQLKDELDRIAYSTEFNTKKLLDGSSAALWSADNSDIEAVIRGQVAEGNYQLVKSAEPLTNHVLKTDIFKLKDGAISQVEDGSPHQFRFSLGTNGDVTDATTTGNLNFIFSFDGGATTFSVSVNSGSGAAAGFTDAEVLARAINADSNINDYVEAELASGGDIILRAKDMTADTDLYRLSMTVTGGGSTTNWAGQISDWTGGNLSESSDILNGGIAFTGFDTLTTAAGTAGTLGTDRQTNTDNIVIDRVSNAQGLTDGDYDLVTVAGDAARSLDLETDAGYLMGAFRTSESTGEITAVGGVALTENAYAIVEVIGEGGDGTVDLKVSWDQGSTWTTYFDYASGVDAIQKVDGDATNQFTLTLDTGTFRVGDKFLLGMQNAITDTHGAARLTGSANDWTNLQATDGDWDPREGNAGADYNTLNHGLWEDAGENPENGSVVMTYARMDEEGRIQFGTMDVDFGTTFSDKSTNITVLGSGDVAGPDTLLSKVDQFYDSNGNFVLGEDGKWIDVYTADGRNATFYIDGGDTIQELADKIEQIISLDTTDQGWAGLNLGRVLDDSGINHVTDYVMNSTENSDEAVPGTIVVRSPKQGTGGYLYFSAEEDLLKALSLTTINDPAQDVDPLTVEVYNAHTGELIGSDKVSDNVLHGVIQGVDVIIDSNVDVSSSWNSITKQIDFYSSPGEEIEYLHIVSATTDFQIGANPGQTMNAYIAQMDTVALGVENALVINQDTAYDAMDRIDNAIQLVSSERARIGAYINRLDHTIASLGVQEENQLAAESTIRDLDMASAISEMTQYQILQQVGVAMLGQANMLPQTLMSLLQ